MTNPSSSVSRDAARIAVAILATLLVFALVVWLVPTFDQQVAAAKEASAPEFLSELRTAIQPEPREKLLYQLGVFVGTGVPIAVYLLLRRLGWPRRAWIPKVVV